MNQKQIVKTEVIKGYGKFLQGFVFNILGL